jgi:hypothetical protein
VGSVRCELRKVIRVPEVVRRKALAVGAGRWLDDLPLLVASVEQEWGIAVGDAYGDSTEAFVAKATCEDDTPAV